VKTQAPPVLFAGPKRVRRHRWIGRVLVACAVLLAAVLSTMPEAMRAYVIQAFTVPTGAMKPTLMGIRLDANGRRIPKDHIVVEKLSYRFHPPRRGDIVVFRTESIEALGPKSRGKLYLKRVVGLPGERVSIQPPYVLINGEKLMDPPIFKQIAEQLEDFSGYTLAQPSSGLLRRPSDALQVPEGEFCVLGDNSDHSFDSRYWGTVPVGDIVGRVIGIYWPLDRIGTPN